MDRDDGPEIAKDETQEFERPQFELEHLDYLSEHGNGD